MRKELLALMQRTNDPFAEAFARRDNKELRRRVLEKVKQEYGGYFGLILTKKSSSWNSTAFSMGIWR
jgi:hypothetical protein